MLQRPPHPTLEFAHLVPATSHKRLSSLPRARELHYFFNARAALFHVLRSLRREGRTRVLLPAFHCVSVVEPAVRAGMQVSFYRIDRRLEIDAGDLHALCGSDVAAVVLINYFGMQARIEPLIEGLRAQGVAVIEDCSHSFMLANPLALSGGRADLSIYSFWKLVPSGIGGGLLSASQWPAPPLGSPALKDSVVRTKRLLEEVVVSRGLDSLLARIYARIEAARVRRRHAAAATRSDSGAAQASAADPALEFDERSASTRLPWLPRHIVGCADLQGIVAARRRHSLVYARRRADAAGPRCVLPERPERACPWAFPVIVPQRSRHDLRLRERGIPVWTFGNMLHPALAGAASAAADRDARYLADNLLCLPVHQGIGEQEADRFARELLMHFESKADDAA